MELLAVLSDRAGGVGRVEFHAEPEVHVQKRQQCAEGNGAGALLLRGIHAAVHDLRKLAGRILPLERISGDSPQYALEFCLSLIHI